MQEPEVRRPGPTVRDLEESWSAVVHDTMVGGTLAREMEAQRRSSSTPPAERAPLPDLGELGFRSETPPAGLRIVPQPLVEPAPRLPQGLDVSPTETPDAPSAPEAPAPAPQPAPEAMDADASPVLLVARKSAVPVERPSLDTPDAEGLDATAMIPGDLMLQLLQASSQESIAPAPPAETPPVVAAPDTPPAAPAPTAEAAEKPAEAAEQAAEKPAEAIDAAPFPEAAPAAEPGPVAPASADAAPAAEPAPAEAAPVAEATAAVAAPAPVSTKEPAASRVPAESEGGWLRPVLLVLAVAAAFAGSYFAVRHWVASPPELQPEAPSELPEPGADAAVAVDAAAVEAPSPVQGEGVGPDAATPTDADTRYVDPQTYLDGGSLAAGTGLIVIRAPRAGASAVSVDLDRQALGQAPVQARASEGLHTLRYRAGILTSFQFVSVRSGRAVVLDPPSDR
jgi:hypothetical protein